MGGAGAAERQVGGVGGGAPAYAARMTPAAVIPMHTPEEALAELDHVVELGLKAVSFAT